MWVRFVIIFIIVLLAEIYCYILIRSVIKSLPIYLRGSIMAFYLVITAFYWLYLLLLNRTDIIIKMPIGLQNFCNTLFTGLLIGKVLVMLVMLIDDIRRVIVWAFTTLFPLKTDSTLPHDAITRSIFMKRLALLLGGSAVLGFMYGTSNKYNYQVRKIKIKFPNLPESFRGLRMVQVSDIHTGSFDSHKDVENGINKILELKPDIIFFTGDLVNNIADEITDEYHTIFSKLSAPMGVYSILGNHDYGDYKTWASTEAKEQNLNKLKNHHYTMGWRLLINEHLVFERADDKIALLGIENWSAKAHFPKYGDLMKAYEGLKEKNIPFKILLSHDPSHWDEQVFPDYKDINLTLSGHTHGMQFGVDSKYFKWSPVQYMYNKWAGLYGTENQYLYVNRGFGFLGYKGRIGIMPEITLIELA